MTPLNGKLSINVNKQNFTLHQAHFSKYHKNIPFDVKGTTEVLPDCTDAQVVQCVYHPHLLVCTVFHADTIMA